jgi:hypothetical protein
MRNRFHRSPQRLEDASSELPRSLLTQIAANDQAQGTCRAGYAFDRYNTVNESDIAAAFARFSHGPATTTTREEAARVRLHEVADAAVGLMLA